MIPCSFAQSNRCLGRPADMTEEQCDPLSIADAQLPDGTPLIVSCWKLTKEELDEFNRTGRIWLAVCGHTMPPVILSGTSLFE